MSWKYEQDILPRITVWCLFNTNWLTDCNKY